MLTADRVRRHGWSCSGVIRMLFARTRKRPVTMAAHMA